MRSVVVFGLSLVFVSMGVPTFAQSLDDRPMSSLSVIGHGKVAAMPDVADINLGIVTEAATAKDALRINSEAMTTLHKALEAKGVAPKDIETTQIQVSPIYSQPTPGAQPRGGEFVPKVVGYRVVNAVEVTARQIGKLGELLDNLVEAGANQVNGISFRVEKAEQLMDEARKRAVADAKRKAELLATETKVVLGPARMITEAGSSPLRPNYLGGPAYSTMSPRSAPPVAAGEQELSVSIQISYSIMPPKN